MQVNSDNPVSDELKQQSIRHRSFSLSLPLNQLSDSDDKESSAAASDVNQNAVNRPVKSSGFQNIIDDAFIGVKFAQRTPNRWVKEVLIEAAQKVVTDTNQVQLVQDASKVVKVSVKLVSKS